MLLPLVSACKKEAGPEEEEAIKVVIVKYDMALIETYRSLDVKALLKLASVREVSKNEALLVDLAKKKVYMESELLDIRFVEFKWKSRKEADVRVSERWRWRQVNIETGKEVRPWVEEDYKLVYHMTKDNKMGWIVDSLRFEK